MLCDLIRAEDEVDFGSCVPLPQTQESWESGAVAVTLARAEPGLRDLDGPGSTVTEPHGHPCRDIVESHRTTHSPAACPLAEAGHAHLGSHVTPSHTATQA